MRSPNSSRRSRRVSTRRRGRGETPGRVALHRLNRVEYATAVRDLLGVSIDASRLLPADVTSDGFDNVAEVLRVSPTYLDQYIAAAREISMRAVGNRRRRPARAEYLPKNKNRTAARRRPAARHPRRPRRRALLPGRRRVRLQLDVSSEPGAELRAYPHGWLEYRHTAILTIDGVKVFDAELGGERTCATSTGCRSPRSTRSRTVSATSAAGESRLPRGRRGVRRAQLRGVGLCAADLRAGRGHSRRAADARHRDRRPYDPSGISASDAQPRAHLHVLPRDRGGGSCRARSAF